MYAVVQTGGKQYKVQQGTQIRVEKLETGEGKEVKLEVVMIVADGKTILGKGSVTAKVLEHGKGDKLEIFKYKPKKNYRRRQGHRQPYTKIEITKIAV
jgi:large subunit ribosomal protein L21